MSVSPNAKLLIVVVVTILGVFITNHFQKRKYSNSRARRPRFDEQSEHTTPPASPSSPSPSPSPSTTHVNRVPVVNESYTVPPSVVHGDNETVNELDNETSTALPSPSTGNETEKEEIMTDTSTPPPPPQGKPIIVNYMSLLPDNPDTPPYATSAFVYTALFAAANNLRFVYYTSPAEEPKVSTDKTLPVGCEGGSWCRHGKAFKCTSSCVGPNGCLLHPVWCKVKSMKTAMASYPNAPFLLSLDTDAIVRFEDFNIDLAKWVGTTLERKGYPLEQRPLVANLEQPGWWCHHVMKKSNESGQKYRHCVNTGVVLVGNSEKGRNVVDFWWNTSLGDYAKNPLKFKFRTDWPWEQDRMMAMLNEERLGQFNSVQVLPDKDLYHQPNWFIAEKQPGACLGAVPRWRCLINHFCADLGMKLYWGNRIMSFVLALLQGCAANTAPEIKFPVGKYDAVPPAYPMSLTIPLDGWCTPEVANLTRGITPEDLNSPQSNSDPDAKSDVYKKRYAVLLKAAAYLKSRHVVELQ